MRRVAAICAVFAPLFLCAAPASAQLAPGGMHGGGGASDKPGWVMEPGWLTLNKSDERAEAPELHFKGPGGEWLIGGDVANGPGGRDFVLAATIDPESRRTGDLIYITPTHWGPRVGVGLTPPPLPYRLQTAGQGTEGGLGIATQPGGTGHPLGITDSNGRDRLWVDTAFTLHAPQVIVGGVAIDPARVNARLDALEQQPAAVRVLRDTVPPDTSALERRITANRSRAVRAERRLRRLERVISRIR